LFDYISGETLKVIILHKASSAWSKLSCAECEVVATYPTLSKTVYLRTKLPKESMQIIIYQQLFYKK
jgi:hypothetical protein